MTVNLGVNYLAVIVAAIVAVGIGIIYYGILGVGDRQSRMLGTALTRPGPTQGAVGLVLSLVNAWVIAVLSRMVGAASFGDAVVLGAFVWLGFGAAFKAAQVAFEGRPWSVWLLQAVHDLVVDVVVALIVTLWR